MSRLIIALLGGGAGLGLLIILRAFRTRATPLSDLSRTLSTTGLSVAEQLAAASAVSGNGAGTGGAGSGRTAERRGARWAAGLVESFGIGDLNLLRSRLRVLGKSMEQHAFEKLMAAVAGFVLPILLMMVLWVGGISPPVLPLLLLSMVLAVGGFLYPDLPLADAVVERRRSFRHALGAYLELVSVLLAGGAGTQTALAAAAESGNGWAFVELRRAIDRAAATNRPVAELFAELGDELGADDLKDLASSLTLAGGHGARVKESLIAKSDSMRHSLAADLEFLAESRTEKMIIPVAIMTVGLTLFVGFAALNAIGADPDGAELDVLSTDLDLPDR